jgi:hypothetical protein
MTTGPARALRDAAVAAERVAVARQYACRRAHSPENRVVADLQCATDALGRAANLVDTRVVLPRTVVTTLIAMAAAVTVVLVLVPHPADPLVLATALVAGLIAAEAAVEAHRRIVQRRTAHVAAAEHPTPPFDAVAGLRNRITAIRAALDPEREASHLDAGRELERALYWLDWADEDLIHEPRLESLSDTYQLTAGRSPSASGIHRRPWRRTFRASRRPRSRRAG